MKKFLKRFWREESGQDLIEYTLLLAFVALASASLFLSAGGSVAGSGRARATSCRSRGCRGELGHCAAGRGARRGARCR